MNQVNAVLDERSLFITVLVDGQPLRGLFDPGSCCTYVVKPAFGNFSDLLKKLASQVRPGIIYPSGVIEETAGQSYLPLEFLGIRKSLQVRFAATFDCEVLFGHYFAELFDFDVRFKPRIWRLGNGIWRTYHGQELGPKTNITSEILENRVEPASNSFSYEPCKPAQA